MAKEFLFDLRRREEHAFLQLAGDLDLASVDCLERCLREVQGTTSLLVDLKDVRYADSSGIRLLVETARRMEERGSDFRIRGASPRVQRTFSLLGLQELLDKASAKAADPLPPWATGSPRGAVPCSSLHVLRRKGVVASRNYRRARSFGA